MKTKNLLNASCLGLCCAASIALVASSTIASAQTTNTNANPAKIEADKLVATISVSVPEEGATVTFTVAGKSFTITGGKSLELPGGAKNIVLSKGAKVESRRENSNGSKTIALFELNSDTTLSEISPTAVRGSMGSLTLIKLVVISPLGVLKSYDYLTIKPTSKEANSLVAAAQTIKTTTTLNNTVVGATSTDG